MKSKVKKWFGFACAAVFAVALCCPLLACADKDKDGDGDDGGNEQDATIALCAALFAIVAWATAAWKFGIPTSESHALIAGLSGAAIALHGSFAGINPQEWVKVIYGLVLSTVLGFVAGFGAARLIEWIAGAWIGERPPCFSAAARSRARLPWRSCTARKMGKNL